MKPAPFSYSAPRWRAAAIGALSGEAPPRILAGGQSLVPMLNLRLAPVDALLDITRVAELRQIEETATSIRYGALTTHAAIEDRKVPDATNGLMPHVAGHIAYRAVRNRGTIGGALALADPAADWVTALVTLEGIVHVVSEAAARAIASENFILGPYFTALNDRELIEAVEIPKRSATERWGYHKVVLKIGEYAESMSMVLLDPQRGFARVVLGATAGPPLVLHQTAKSVLERRSEAEIGNALRDELRASGQEFTPGQLILHRTTVLRAIKDAQSR